MKHQVIRPRDWPFSPSPYSPAVRKGNMIFTSGQLALNEKQELIGKDDIKLQAKQALHNVRACLDAAGATLQDVVMVHVYLTDAAHFAGMNEIYRQFFSDNFPARSTVIAQLVKKEFLVEIEAIAVTG